MAQVFHSYYQNLSLILFLTCPVSYHSSPLGHIDKEYQKIQKNGPIMAINGFKITPIQQLQANSQQIIQENIIKLPGLKKNSVSAIRTNWLDTVSLTVQEIQHFKVWKLAKNTSLVSFFCQKNHENGSNLSFLLTKFVPTTVYDLSCIISLLKFGPY